MSLTDSESKAAQKLTAKAVRNLRERAGLLQADIGKAMKISTQAYQKYEAGERKFTAEKLKVILDKIQVEDYDLDAEKARILGREPDKPVDYLSRGDQSWTIDVYGRARAGAIGTQSYDVSEPLRTVDLRTILGKSVDALEVAGDSMTPWAEPGEIVIFDRDRHPKRGAGCVIETKAGEYYVKLYHGSDGFTVFVKELHPEEKIVNFVRSELKGVYAIRLRGD